MENDARMIELLADMLHEQKAQREEQQQMTIVIQRLETGQDQMTRAIERLATGQERNTQAILSLTSLLQKTVIEPTAHHADKLADLERRVERLERLEQGH
jgi:phage gp37-like protein